MLSKPCHLRFWGVRGSIPTPGPSTLYYGGNTSCVEVRADGEIIILDAGTGIRALGRALEEEFAAQAEPLRVTILISHPHWDHIQGFPFFQPAYNPKNQITIHGYNGTAVGLKAAIAGQMEAPYFPVSLADMAAQIEICEMHESDFEIGRVQVQAFSARHPGGAMGYRLTTSSGTFGYMPDNEVISKRTVEPGTDNTDSTGQPLSELRNQFVDFMRDVDVMVLDSQYASDEYDHHVGWGHGCVDDVVELAIDAGVRRLELFHHDPDHDDQAIARMLAHAREIVARQASPLHIEAAREGGIVSLA